MKHIIIYYRIFPVIPGGIGSGSQLSWQRWKWPRTCPSWKIRSWTRCESLDTKVFVPNYPGMRYLTISDYPHRTDIPQSHPSHMSEFIYIYIYSNIIYIYYVSLPVKNKNRHVKNTWLWVNMLCEGPARRSTGDGRIFAERVQCRMWGYNNRSTRLVMNGYVMA